MKSLYFLFLICTSHGSKSDVRGGSQTTFTRGGVVGCPKMSTFDNVYEVGNVNGGG